MDGERIWVFDTRNCADRLSAVGGWVKLRMYWGSRSSVLRRDMPTYIDMSLIYCTEEVTYAIRMAPILINGLELADTVPATHSMKCFVFLRFYDSLPHLTNFEYL